MQVNSGLRIRLIFTVVALLSLALLVRLFFIQIIKGSYYRARADHQYQLPAGNLEDRGSIYFQTKDGQEVSAATMQDGFLLAIAPKSITDADTTYDKLNTIFPLNGEDFYAKVSKTADPYEELSNRVDKTAADKIQALKLPGVIIAKNRWRVYPGQALAAHVVGFMGYEGNTYTGRYGLERYYNDTLRRDPDKSFISFIAEAFSEIGGGAKKDNTSTEADLVTTIEPTVEQTLESVLAKTKEEYSADAIGAIVMDPKTGEIAAMAAMPNFDPGGKVESVEVLKNPLVESVYEMGSIVKPLTMAAALDAGAVTPQTTYNDEGFLVINTKRIANFDGKGRGIVPMQEVLNQSLNTGAVFAEQKLGKDKFRTYFTNYGLGEKTGIDLPNEVSGLLKNLQSPREVEYATAAFGQGIAVSPLEITRALASLGNGGVLVRPHVVKRFDRVGTTASIPVEPVIQRQVLKPETSKTITKMLVGVVDTALAHGKVKMEHYSIAAKTGTAQMSNGAGGYYEDRYLHSFFGYFPASNPRFIIFMYILYPKGVQYASETLTNPFMELTKFLLNYYNIPPDR